MNSNPLLHLEDVIKYVTTGSRLASSQQSPNGRSSNCSLSDIHLLYCGLKRRSRRAGQDPMWFSKAWSRFLPYCTGYVLGRSQGDTTAPKQVDMMMHIANCSGTLGYELQSKILKICGKNLGWTQGRKPMKTCFSSSIGVFPNGFRGGLAFPFMFGKCAQIQLVYFSHVWPQPRSFWAWPSMVHHP